MKIGLRIFLLVIVFNSCAERKKKDTLSSQGTFIVKYETLAVCVSPLKLTSLALTTTSHGIAVASKEMQLTTLLSGILETCMVSNGDKVSSGELLFSLDSNELSLDVAKFRSAYERALISYEEMLLGTGSRGIANNKQGQLIRRNLEFTSGLSLAKLQLQESEIQVKKAKTYAHFDGIITNISVKEGDFIPTNSTIAILHAPNSLVVKFKLPEAFAQVIRPGMTVKAKPIFIDSLELRGEIIEVNPSIDKNGMIEMVAGTFSHPTLLPGMNLEIEVQAHLPPSFIVVKEAVIYRSGKPVIFTYDNGRAKWNYVKLGQENGKEVQVLEGLKEGDLVITSNIVLLDHDSPVEIAGQESSAPEAAK